MSLESLLANLGTTEVSKPSAELIIRRLACNKPMRIFMQSIAGMSKDKFQEFVSDFRALYNIAQGDIIAKEDSGIMLEIVKYPHFLAFIKRLAE
jgi:hypothetical protein